MVPPTRCAMSITDPVSAGSGARSHCRTASARCSQASPSRVLATAFQASVTERPGCAVVPGVDVDHGHRQRLREEPGGPAPDRSTHHQGHGRCCGRQRAEAAGVAVDGRSQSREDGLECADGVVGRGDEDAAGVAVVLFDRFDHRGAKGQPQRGERVAVIG